MCTLCNEAYKDGTPWWGSDPVCGFGENGKFTPTNWNCATLGKLRELIEEGVGGNFTPSYRDRWDDCSIGVLRAPEGSHLIMTWYKERGNVADVFLVRDGERRSLQIEGAEAIIEMYSNPTLIKTT